MRTSLASVLASLLALSVVAVAPACKKQEEAAAPVKTAAPAAASATAPTPAPAADGVRRVSIEASADGYKPERIVGKPGEKLTLVFTRVVDAECISQVRMPDGKLVDLPLNKPVEVAITVPTAGEVGFACGMDMIHGVVVAQPAS